MACAKLSPARLRTRRRPPRNSMTRFACTLALLFWAAQASAQTPTAVPRPSSLVYLGTAAGPVRGSLGDVQLGNGLALRNTGTGLKVYVGSRLNGVQQVIEADVPASFTGKL